MSTIDIPVGGIKTQNETSSPFEQQNILVDDTVALVDDITALSGGPTTPTTSIPVSLDKPVARPTIRIAR